MQIHSHFRITASFKEVFTYYLNSRSAQGVEPHESNQNVGKAIMAFQFVPRLEKERK